MKSTEELSFRAVNEKRGLAQSPPVTAAVSTPPQGAASLPTIPAATGNSLLARLPFDPWRVLSAVWRRKFLVLIIAVACAAGGAVFGFWRFSSRFSTSTALIRQEMPNSFQTSATGEAFRPKSLTVGTLVSVMKSPTLLKKVAAESRPPVSPGMLSQRLIITPERNTDVLRIDYEDFSSPTATANTLNLYAEAVVQMTRDLQALEASQVNRVLKQQLATIEAELATLGGEILGFSKDAHLISADKEMDAYLRELGDLSLKYETLRIEFETIDLRLKSLQDELARHNPVAEKLQMARSELDNMLVRYTEANPLVSEQRQRVEALEKEAKAAGEHPPGEAQLAASAAGTSLYLEIVQLRAQKQTMAQQLEKLGKVRDAVQTKLSSLPEKSVQLARLTARQQSLETARNMLASRQREAGMFEAHPTGFYRQLSPVSAQDVEVKGRSLRLMLTTVVFGILGMMGVIGVIAVREIADGRILTSKDLERVSKLPLALDVASLSDVAGAQWSFRAWTGVSSKIVPTASGALVLGIASQRAMPGSASVITALATAAVERGHTVIVVLAGEPGVSGFTHRALMHPLESALAEPHCVSSGGTSWISLLIAGEGWRWTREHRQQWLAACNAWKGLRSLVVLVELPEVSSPDSLLFAESLPNLLWLSAEKEDSAAVRVCTEALHATRCRVIGSAFLRGPGPANSGATPALATVAAMLALLCLPMATHGQTAPGEAPKSLPAWQERLTLGPGDTLNLALFGHDSFARSEVPIGPDGRLSYLEARDIPAAGKTIDELRAVLDAELGKFYRNARTIITPGTLSSKKYYMLGKVVDKGVFTLERPLTILEAVARSRGLETGLFQQNTVELADLARAFLSRRGQRMPVDFVRLFQNGDMSQNIQIEPGDYIYFPSANVNEVYVLGAVQSPGSQGFTPNASVVGMATLRGGFSPKAWLDRVLVVRGSLSKPQVFEVNVRKVLKGQATDIRLQPKDIVFVADKPWARAEELVEMAIRTFVQASAAGWASGNVGPIITAPILPSL